MSDALSAMSPIVGATLLALTLLSITTWSIALVKLLRQFRTAKSDLAFRQAFRDAPDWAGAARAVAEGVGELALLGRAGFAELQSIADAGDASRHTAAPLETLERCLRQTMQNMQRASERGLAELATIGSTAPFVGLFGTVWGIMHALQDIGKNGAANLEVVAGPIGGALVATAIGIATALPAVLAYNFFFRRLRVRVTEWENFTHEYVARAARHDFNP